MKTEYLMTRLTLSWLTSTASRKFSDLVFCHASTLMAPPAESLTLVIVQRVTEDFEIRKLD
jgi:hypothetical protein